MTWTHGRVGLLLAGGMVLAFLAGGSVVGGGDSADSEAPVVGHGHDHGHGQGKTTPGGEEEASTIWTCSMDPQVRMSEPGRCPICGMDLIPVKAGNGPPRVEMSEDARRLAGIQTTKVARKEVSIPLSLVGRVAYDETATARIAARFGGRIERMFVDYEGTQVRKGDHLYQIYSPELWVAQEELIQAERALSRLPSGASDVLRDSLQQSARAAREKLKLWELRSWQIRRIAKTRKKTRKVTIYAPTGGIVLKKSVDEGAYVKEGQPIYTIADLSRVWVTLDVYESDVQWIRWGQTVRFEVAAYPGQTFQGKVAFVAPAMDPKTRTVQVRLTVPNTDGMLKPEMYVRARLQVPVQGPTSTASASLAGKYVSPMHPEVTADGPGKCTVCGMDLVPAEEHWLVGPALKRGGAIKAPLVVPASAPLVTGKRAVVFVAMAGAKEPTYLLREVVLGPRAGDWYVVKEGLMEGEVVVVEGAFKLDSALQIRGDRSLMSLEPEPTPKPTVNPADAIDPTAKDAVSTASKAIQDAREAAEEGDGAGLRRAADALVGVVQKDEKLHLLRGPATWLLTAAQDADNTKAQQAALRELWTLGSAIAPLKLPRVGDMSPPQPRAFAKALLALAEAAAKLSVTLAADDFEGSQKAAPAVAKAMDKLAKAKRPLDPVMVAAAMGLPKLSDMAALRSEYGKVSAGLVPMVDAHRGVVKAKLQRSYCPMAFKDTGAYWLEPTGELANPYYGSQMLRCGMVGARYE